MFVLTVASMFPTVKPDADNAARGPLMYATTEQAKWQTLERNIDEPVLPYKPITQETVTAIESFLIEEKRRKDALVLEEQRKQEWTRSFEANYTTSEPEKLLEYKAEDWEPVGPRLGTLAQQQNKKLLYQRKRQQQALLTVDTQGPHTEAKVETPNAPAEPEIKQESAAAWLRTFDCKTIDNPAWLQKFRTGHWISLEITNDEFYAQQCKENDEKWLEEFMQTPKFGPNSEKLKQEEWAKQQAESRRLWENLRVGRDMSGKTCVR